MSKKTRPLLIVALSALLLAAAFGVAEAHRDFDRHAGSAGCPMMEPVMKQRCSGMEVRRHGAPQPGYTQEQLQKYEAILNEFKPRMEPLRDEIFVKRQVLSALRNSASPDAQAVARAAEDLVKARNAMAKMHQELSGRLEKEVGAPAELPSGGPCPGGMRGERPCVGQGMPCAPRP